MVKFILNDNRVCVPTWAKFNNNAIWKKCQLGTFSALYHYQVFSEYGTWKPWLDYVAQILRESYGLENNFANRAAILLAYMSSERLQPVIHRGWSSPKHQNDLRDAWDRGDRAGLRVRPAADSLHTKTGWLGSPASKAIDISTINDARSAQIARALGIGAGVDFKQPDPGHYYDKG